MSSSKTPDYVLSSLRQSVANAVNWWNVRSFTIGIATGDVEAWKAVHKAGKVVQLYQADRKGDAALVRDDLTKWFGKHGKWIDVGTTGNDETFGGSHPIVVFLALWYSGRGAAKKQT